MPSPTRVPDDRPLHLRPALVTWVALGGTVGTAARIGADAVLLAPAGLPLPTLVINLAGALLLGALLEALARAGDDTGGRRLLRLAAGTGFCGAFTTYSSLAVEADLLAAGGRTGWAVGYLLVSVVAGLAATAAGVALASGRRRPRPLRAGAVR